MQYSFNLNEDFSSFAVSVPADGCTQCGICLSSCPTFNITEDVEQSPMGRIRMMRAIESGDTDGMDPDKLESCVGCYTCASICPSKVNYENMLDTALDKLRTNRPLPVITRSMLALALKPWLIRLMIRLTAIGQNLGVRWLAKKFGVLKFSGLERGNRVLGKVSLPTRSVENKFNVLGPARASQLVNMINMTGAEIRNRTNRHRRVSLFKGCFTSVLEQNVQQASIDILNALGIEVVIPHGQGCCGALHRHNGNSEMAKQLARKNIATFNTENSSAIISTSSGCGSSLQKYSEWLKGEQTNDFLKPVLDINHFLATVLHERKVVFSPLSLRVAIHTPCSLKQASGQVEAVRTLLNYIPKLEIHEIGQSTSCCGAGGSHMLTQPEVADPLREQIIDEVMQLKPDVIISSNLGCAMHLRAGLEESGVDIPVEHPVQLLSRAIQIEFVTINAKQSA